MKIKSHVALVIRYTWYVFKFGLLINLKSPIVHSTCMYAQIGVMHIMINGLYLDGSLLTLLAKYFKKQFQTPPYESFRPRMRLSELKRFMYLSICDLALWGLWVQ